MAEITITLPFEPGQEVYIVWNNLIQKGIVPSININLTKPSTSLIEEVKVKVQLATDVNRIVYKLIDEVFLTPDDAALWLEMNVVPPSIPLF